MDLNIDKILTAAIEEIEAARTPDGVRELNTKYLGRKGIVTQFLRNIAQLPVAERPEAGRRANEVKQQIDALCREATERIDNQGGDAGHWIDVTLPGRSASSGSLHPITRIADEICTIFSRMGFEVVEGPEVESDYYNFEALNFPKDHPARDMQDTFFVSEDVVLRTHTSPTQPRVMEKQDPPVRIIAPGKVYRCDSDLTHTPMFHQVEGLLVDDGISFGDLKGVLTELCASDFR